MEHDFLTRHQGQYKDRLFKFIFGRDDENSKKWRLELYNALNGTNYTDPDALELNTIENVIYITMHNDISSLCQRVGALSANAKKNYYTE